MQKTELKRKTPLKPGKGLKRCGKIRKKRRPRNRELWTNKQWRDECDKLFSQIIRLEAVLSSANPDSDICAVCATLPLEKRVNATQFHTHHLISRERMFFRHTLTNGMCLCNRHHNNDPHLSAHGAPWAFEKWLKEHAPERYKWWLKNRNECYTGIKIDYQQIHSVLAAKLRELEQAYGEGDSDE